VVLETKRYVRTHSLSLSPALTLWGRDYCSDSETPLIQAHRSVSHRIASLLASVCRHPSIGIVIGSCRRVSPSFVASPPSKVLHRPSLLSSTSSWSSFSFWSWSSTPLQLRHALLQPTLFHNTSRRSSRPLFSLVPPVQHHTKDTTSSPHSTRYSRYTPVSIIASPGASPTDSFSVPNDPLATSSREPSGYDSVPPPSRSRPRSDATASTFR
jgi:hypothetical protein